jgi:rhodanese-related sulfurtransferase
MNIKNLSISLLFIVWLGSLNDLVAQSSQAEDIKTISTKKTQKLAKKNVVLVDLRTQEEFAEKTYNVKNIINIPIDSLASNLYLISKDQKVVLVCRTGNKSKKAFLLLKDNGYTKMFHMEGGIVKWAADGFAVTTPKAVACCKSNKEDCKKECKAGNQASVKSCCKI